MTHLLDVCEILHDLNQAHHRANDAHRRRVPAGAFENLGFFLPTGPADFHLELHHAANLLYVGAIDAQGKGFPQEGVLDLHGLAFQRNQPVLARFGGIANQFLNRCVRRLRLVEEHVNQTHHRPLEHDQWSAHHDRPERPAKDDQRRGEL